MIPAGGVIDLDLRVARADRLVPALDSVPAAASMALFEARRRAGKGAFLTREQIARKEGRSMADVVRSLRGALVRPQGASSAILQSATMLFSCPSAVWLDLRPLYYGGFGDPPDLNQFQPRHFEALEYYADERRTPPTFRGLGECGLLVLHSRR